MRLRVWWFMFSLFVVIGVCGRTAPAQMVLPDPYNINTVAGNGTSGLSGDGGSAVNAMLQTTGGIATDQLGNLYISDFLNCRIREVSKATGIISTFAGTSCGGSFSGNGGQATNAVFASPEFVATDTAGNVYIVDGGPGIVLKVANGVISQLADFSSTTCFADGNYAQTAITGIAADSNGNVYVADQACNMIRKVASNGAVSVFAGSGNSGYAGDGSAATGALLFQPQGLATDVNGNLFIADSGNSVIREVTTAGIIQTVSPHLGGAAIGVAVDPDGNVFAGANAGSGIVFKISGGVATPVAGNGQGTAGYNNFNGDNILAVNAQLSTPSSIAIDRFYNLFVSDQFAMRVRAVTLTVPTVTTVSSSNSSVYYGVNVTFTAHVTAASGTPTGIVTFYADGSSIGSAGLSGGYASVSSSSLGIGSHSITAYYAGNAPYLASNGGTSQTITQIPTGINFTTSPNPSLVTNPVSIQIQVTAADGSTPSGTVSVSADGNSLGSLTLNGSGAASMSTSSLAVGSHSVTVSYNGTAVYYSSYSTQSQTVNQIPTSTSVVASPPSSTYLQCVTFQATTTGTIGTPTGTTTFTARAGSTTIALGSAGLNGSGVASVQNCSLQGGSYTVTASYGGSTNFVASSGSSPETVTTLVVVQPPPSTPPNAPYHPGTPILIPVQPFPTPGGGVTPSQPILIYVSGSPVGSLPPSGGTFPYTPISPGTITIGTCYSGDNNYANTCAPKSPISVTVTAPTTTSVSVSPNPTVFGNKTTVLVNVSSAYGTPTGSVTCSSDLGTIGTSTLNTSGAASFVTAVMPVGSRVVTCSYIPTGTFDPSQGTTTATVVKATPTVSLAITPEPSYPGDYATITASVASSAGVGATGTVTFTVDGGNAGTATLSGGSASISFAFMTVGSHTVNATYGGDGNFNSASASKGHSVIKLPTTTMISATPDPAIGGQQAVTIQSTTIFPNLEPGTPNQRQQLTGTVQFFDGGTSLGTVQIDGATELAKLTVPSMTVGSHTLTAVYSGDANYTASGAAGFTQTMLPPISTIALPNLSAASAGASVTYSTQVMNPLKQPQSGGTITWTANGAPLGTSTVSASGATTFATTFPTPGVYNVVASYTGNEQPGSLSFSQTVLSTGANGNAPFAMSGDATTTMGQDGSTQTTLTLTSAGDNNPVSLSCSGAPDGYTCNLTPATVTLKAGAAAPTVTVNVTHNQPSTQAQGKKGSEIAFAGLGLGLLALFGIRRKGRVLGLLVLMIATMTAGFGLSGCGATNTKTYASYAPQSYQLTITATLDSYKQSFTVKVGR